MKVLVFVSIATVCFTIVQGDEVSDSKKNAAVEERLRTLEEIVRQQQVKIQKQNNRIESLEKSVKELRGNQQRMRKGNETEPEADVELLSNGTLMNITADDDNWTNQCLVECLGDRYPSTTDLIQRRIAFHAYQSVNRCYNNHEIVLFDQEAMDYGGGYTPYDSIFDAPASGVYVFTWTVTSSKTTGWFVAQLIQDGEVVGTITSDPGVSYVPSVGVHPVTGIVTTYVEAGQHVFVKMIHMAESCATVRSDNMVRSTFSGWMLF